MLMTALMLAPSFVSAQTWVTEQIKFGPKVDTTKVVVTDTTLQVKVDTTIVTKVDTLLNTKESLNITTYFFPTGKGVRIAILDNGVDLSNPLFAGITGTSTFSGVSGIDQAPDVCNGHGTAVTGLIQQLAPGATLHAVRVSAPFNGTCTTTSSALIAGLQWAVANNIKLVNVSQQVPDNRALRAAVADAVSKGVVIVAAAGNNGGGVMSPASYPGVIAVASTGPNGLLSSFSSNGTQVLLGAPGEGLAVWRTRNIRSTGTGTSFSAPLVTATIALMLERNKNLTGPQIVNILCNSATQIIGPTPVGCGILNVQKSLANTP
jgi:membrane-anchored mycosin MYCP